ncbi:DUF2800 domain-containing protein [Schaalia sp. lx-100]|uniref:DUF2800 domain-containing protein n=1 Tax=Schaalia sp. lx-100 TaxID=2899081 RepID=UPI001E3B9BA4|nr:DUF2800 domain-containing protein [Schaalia sp. lx-100]MCD4557192.1 DUF2800 domain-containing protein [Schaalia sp. lx-100]
MPERHATLSASSAHRWMHCPPSVKASAHIPDTAGGEAAKEGTAAHALAEHKLNKLFGVKTRKPRSTYINADMERYTDEYAEYVYDVYSRLEDPVKTLFVEHQVDFSHLVPAGFGTADALILSNNVLHVCDLKYGEGIIVDASENPQLMLYALGALYEFDIIFDQIQTVHLHIYQPRRDNISTFTISTSDLAAWGEKQVKPVAALADAGEGEFNAGEWCTFCKLKPTCRARADENLKTIGEAFGKTAELTDVEIAHICTRAPHIKRWLADVGKHALSEALAGKTYAGLKVVAGRSTRKYKDEKAAIAAAQAGGYDDIFEKNLIGIPAMEKLMGAENFQKILGDLIYKPEGSPVLVPETDKREPIRTTTPADAFGEN